MLDAQTISTPKEDLLQEEMLLEREAINAGFERLHKDIAKAEERAYGSHTVYGCAMRDESLPVVAEAVRETIWKLNKGKNGAFFKDIYEHIKDLEPEAIAHIGLVRTMDEVFNTRQKGTDYPRVQHVCHVIGVALQEEMQLRYYEKLDPDFYSRIKRKYWLSTTGTQQKQTVMQLMFNRADHEPWQKWGYDLTIRLGTWLLDLISDNTGWFHRVIKKKGNKSQAFITPTPLCLQHKEDLIEQAEAYSSPRWPMIIPPRPWSNSERGGYLLAEAMYGCELVRHGNPALEQEETPLEFLNKLQRTAYRINRDVLAVAEEIDKRRTPVGTFLPELHEIPQPNKPADIEENEESRQTYRRAKAEAHNEQAYYIKRCVRSKNQLRMAKLFSEKDAFYLPWSFDYRGRVYPIPPYLTPQDTDFGKSLIRFADEVEVTDQAIYWLSFHAATTYGCGLDKATMDERQEWVGDNLNLIFDIAKDPIRHLPDWEAADEPWQFLACCIELHGVLSGSRSTTGLCVAVDATCSGLQILAGLAKDKSTARLVNVTPSDKPQDAYKAVAIEAIPDCPASIVPYMDRKTTKRTVMTLPYAATAHSNRSYIREALQEKGAEFTPDELTQTVKAVRAAMRRITPGPMDVMDWIKEEMGNCIKRGDQEIKWRTPSGFWVEQRRNKDNLIRMELKLLGRINLTVKNGETDEPDLNKHKSSGAPNLIHSLDSALLHLAFVKFKHPFTVIHDSVLCRATDMSELNDIVRETYKELFADNDYLTDWANQIGAISPPPLIGTLDPEEVVNSTYFFC